MSHAAAALDLPPPYRLITLREAGDAHLHACGLASEAGAGTFVWVRRYDVLEIAVVLEPGEKLALARRAFFVGMAALGDAVAAHCPAETALTYDWPDTLRLDGARIGGGRLGWPADCREDDVAPWLVLSAMLIAAKPAADGDLTPGSTSFEDAGFHPDARERVAESFARHLLRYFDQYESDGFAPIMARYLARLDPGEASRRGIRAIGALVAEERGSGGRRRRRPLVPMLSVPGWLDPESGSVRL